MSIIYKYDECPSFMNEMGVHHIWRMHVLNSGCQSYVYDGCPSYLMYYSHKCPSCERPSWWNQWNVLVGGINQNDMVTFKVHMELMESEVRECRRYGTDWNIGTGERETIDQGIDEIEEKDWNEGIRAMALMEFMKLMGPKQLMEGVIFKELIF